MLPLRKEGLSQQIACLVIHDKTSLWMTSEGSFTPLHFARIVSVEDKPRLTLLIPSCSCEKASVRIAAWSAPSILCTGLWWTGNDVIDFAENVSFSFPKRCKHFEYEHCFHVVAFVPSHELLLIYNQQRRPPSPAPPPLAVTFNVKLSH